jgi:exonuclease I
MTEIQIYKIAILTDMLDLELTKVPIKNIDNQEMQSKLRNLKKSTQILVKHIDKIFEDEEVQEAFGEFSDKINSLIDKELEILK